MDAAQASRQFGKRIKPEALRSGDTIGVVAPSSPLPAAESQVALDRLAQSGFRVWCGQSVTAKAGYLSGPDEVRSRDLNMMFAEPSVKAIFCLKGGYGTPRLLDRLDYAQIQSHPKLLIGYSDITGLHTAINTLTGLITIHGPMVSELAHNECEWSWVHLFRLLTEPEPLGRLVYGEALQQVITPGIAEGELVGGNLSLIVSTLGTPYEIDVKGKVLFLEDVGEEPYRVDRMLTQLRLAGKLEQAAAIVFTDFANCVSTSDDEDRGSVTIEEVLWDRVVDLRVPCFYGFHAGHCRPNIALPIGCRTRVNAGLGMIELLEGAVV